MSDQTIEIPGVKVHVTFSDQSRDPLVVIHTVKGEDGAIIDVTGFKIGMDELASLLHVVATSIEQRDAPQGS